MWANGNNTGFFAQYGSRPNNFAEAYRPNFKQEFNVQNSTIVNIAVGKNICDVKQNGTAANVYTLKNNIFVNFGKEGQVVVGFNKGQTSTTPAWNVDKNAFNYVVSGVLIDKAAAEVTKAGEDIVKNSVEGVVEFIAPDYATTGYFLLNTCAANDEKIGDPRWINVEVPSGIQNVATETGAAVDVNAPMYNLAGQKVGKDYKGIVIQNGKKVMK